MVMRLLQLPLLLVILIVAVFTLLSGSYRAEGGVLDITGALFYKLGQRFGFTAAMLTLLIVAITTVLPLTIRIGVDTYFHHGDEVDKSQLDIITSANPTALLRHDRPQHRDEIARVS